MSIVIVIVTGTGTEVGKTFVTAALARALRERGVDVRARKPVQSFASGDASTDADVLAAATGEVAEQVCPRHRWLPLPMAPPMAADALGQPAFTIADLVAEMDLASGTVTLIEGAGGLLSPLACDGDTRDLIRQCRPEGVVLVADAGLGVINLVRLSVDAFDAISRPILWLNRFDSANDLHQRNAAWLADHVGLDIVTDPSRGAEILLERIRG